LQELPPETEGADAEREPSPEPREPEPQSAPDSRAETPDAVAQPVANGTLSRRAAEAAAAAAAAAAAPAADEGEVGDSLGDIIRCLDGCPMDVRNAVAGTRCPAKIICLSPKPDPDADHNVSLRCSKYSMPCRDYVRLLGAYSSLTPNLLTAPYCCGCVQETESEEEPSWELSEDLREFTGDPGDRKAQLLFKQLQQVRTGACLLRLSDIMPHCWDDRRHLEH